MPRESREQTEFTPAELSLIKRHMSEPGAKLTKEERRLLRRSNLELTHAVLGRDLTSEEHLFQYLKRDALLSPPALVSWTLGIIRVALVIAAAWVGIFVIGVSFLVPTGDDCAYGGKLTWLGPRCELSSDDYDSHLDDWNRLRNRVAEDAYDECLETDETFDRKYTSLREQHCAIVGSELVEILMPSEPTAREVAEGRNQ